MLNEKMNEKYNLGILCVVRRFLSRMRLFLMPYRFKVIYYVHANKLKYISY